jgi:hypothetical protein
MDLAIKKAKEADIGWVSARGISLRMLLKTNNNERLKHIKKNYLLFKYFLLIFT